MNMKETEIELLVTLAKTAKNDGLLKALILKAYVKNEMLIEADKFLDANADFNDSAENLIRLLKNEDPQMYQSIRNEVGENNVKYALLLSIIDEDTVIYDLANRAIAMFELGKNKYGQCYLFVAKMEKPKNFDLELKSFISSYLGSPHLDKDAIKSMLASFTEFSMNKSDANDFKAHIESRLLHINN